VKPKIAISTLVVAGSWRVKVVHSMSSARSSISTRWVAC